MPHKDDGNVEIYTSNTTAPILSMLNKVTAEPEVLRNDLENSMMRKGLLTAFGRKIDIGIHIRIYECVEVGLGHIDEHNFPHTVLSQLL